MGINVYSKYKERNVIMDVFVFEGLGSTFYIDKCYFDKNQLQVLKKYAEKAGIFFEIDLWDYMITPMHVRKPSIFKDWLSSYVSNYVIYKVLQSYHYRPSYVLAYSVGLIFALVSIGSLSFEDGLRLLHCSYTYNGGNTLDKYALAMVVGLNIQVVTDMLDKMNVKDHIEIASETSDYYILLSGLRSSIEEFTVEAEKNGALKCNIIQTPTAFHSKFARSGIEQMVKLTNSIELSHAKIPIISCYGYQLIFSEKEIKKEIIMNVYERINWKDTFNHIVADSNFRFIEVSLSGSVLKMSKSLLNNCEALTFKDIQKQYRNKEQLITL